MKDYLEYIEKVIFIYFCIKKGSSELLVFKKTFRKVPAILSSTTSLL